MNRVGALSNLLLDLFDGPAELRSFVRTHPTLQVIRHNVAWNQPAATVALQVVTKADMQGLWTRPTFNSLRAVRPNMDFDIRSVARQWGVFAILPDASLARSLETWFKSAPGFPGTPENLRALAAAADVPLNGANFLPFDQILQTANARPPTPENVRKLRRMLKKLAEITNTPRDDPSHPLVRAAKSLTESQADPSDAVPATVEVVEREEALVFEEIGFLPAEFLTIGSDAAAIVARIAVTRQFGTRTEGAPSFGTGFLLTERLLLTNHHVVNARHTNEPDANEDDLQLQAQNAVVEFDVDHPGAATTRIPVARLLAWSPRRSIDNPGGLDFAVLELTSPADRAIRPLRTGALPDNLAINIVQHPGGGDKRVALRANQLREQDPDAIRYTSNTDEGSSGSPLFDDDWNLVGLHRASVSTDQVVDGRQLQKLNVGTPIDRVVEALSGGTALGPAVAEAWEAVKGRHGLT